MKPTAGGLEGVVGDMCMSGSGLSWDAGLVEGSFFTFGFVMVFGSLSPRPRISFLICGFPSIFDSCLTFESFLLSLGCFFAGALALAAPAFFVLDGRGGSRSAGLN